MGHVILLFYFSKDLLKSPHLVSLTTARFEGTDKLTEELLGIRSRSPKAMYSLLVGSCRISKSSTNVKWLVGSIVTKSWKKILILWRRCQTSIFAFLHFLQHYLLHIDTCPFHPCSTSLVHILYIMFIGICSGRRER